MRIIDVRRKNIAYGRIPLRRMQRVKIREGICLVSSRQCNFIRCRVVQQGHPVVGRPLGSQFQLVKELVCLPGKDVPVLLGVAVIRGFQGNLPHLAQDVHLLPHRLGCYLQHIVARADIPRALVEAANPRPHPLRDGIGGGIVPRAVDAQPSGDLAENLGKTVLVRVQGVQSVDSRHIVLDNQPRHLSHAPFPCHKA